MSKDLSLNNPTGKTDITEMTTVLIHNEKNDKEFNSVHFSYQKASLEELLTLESSSNSSLSKFTSNDSIVLSEEYIPVDGEQTTFINTWRNVENVSARLIEILDNSVILECLVDRENKVYEERAFKKSLFSEYNVSIGDLFYLRIFERKNESRLEVHNDPKLSFQEDFPKIDFKKEFGNSKLFNPRH